jgi:hypothetical protein
MEFVSSRMFTGPELFMTSAKFAYDPDGLSRDRQRGIPDLHNAASHPREARKLISDPPFPAGKSPHQPRH